MKTTLYRAFDAAGTLLYVGISNNWARRFGDHARTSGWLHQAVRIDLVHFDSREEARAAEIAAIQGERPTHNVADRQGSHFTDFCQRCSGDQVESLYPLQWVPDGSGWLCVYVCDYGHAWTTWHRDAS